MSRLRAGRAAGRSGGRAGGGSAADRLFADIFQRSHRGRGGYGASRRRNHWLGKLLYSTTGQYVALGILGVLLLGLIIGSFVFFKASNTAYLMAKGKHELTEQRVALAEQTFLKLTRQDPSSYDGYVMLGQTYLNMNDQARAEAAFKQASKLTPSDSADEAVDLALSKLALSQSRFETAEVRLIQAFKRNRESMSVRAALLDLYEQWGDTLSKTDITRPLAISKYEQALRFTDSEVQEKNLKDKLVTLIRGQANVLLTRKAANKAEAQSNAAEAIFLLKKSLRFEYSPTTIEAIGEYYQKTGMIDEALNFLREGYNKQPLVVGPKLFNLLMRQAQLLQKQQKPAEARALVAEANRVAHESNLPLYSIYPVSTDKVEVSCPVDQAAGTLSPQITVTFANKGEQPINFLLAKAVFYNEADEALTEVRDTVATAEMPLGMKAVKAAEKTVTFTPATPLAIERLKGKTLKIKVFVAYEPPASDKVLTKKDSDEDWVDEASEWSVKVVRDVRLKGL